MIKESFNLKKILKLSEVFKSIFFAIYEFMMLFNIYFGLYNLGRERCGFIYVRNGIRGQPFLWLKSFIYDRTQRVSG